LEINQGYTTMRGQQIIMTGTLILEKIIPWKGLYLHRFIEIRARVINQCFSTIVGPLPGKFFFHKTRVSSQQIYS